MRTKKVKTTTSTEKPTTIVETVTGRQFLRNWGSASSECVCFKVGRVTSDGDGSYAEISFVDDDGNKASMFYSLYTDDMFGDGDMPDSVEKRLESTMDSVMSLYEAVSEFKEAFEAAYNALHIVSKCGSTEKE